MRPALSEALALAHKQKSYVSSVGKLSWGKGIKRFDQLRKEMRMASFEVCPPPSGYKDWNEAHIDGADLHSWITEKTQAYDFEYLVKSLLE